MSGYREEHIQKIFLPLDKFDDCIFGLGMRVSESSFLHISVRYTFGLKGVF